MHQIFDDEQNLEPERIANRLFLRESGLSFLGDPADLSCFFSHPRKAKRCNTIFFYTENTAETHRKHKHTYV